jgi:hypothetical protein
MLCVQSMQQLRKQSPALLLPAAVSPLQRLQRWLQLHLQIHTVGRLKGLYSQP